MDRGKIENSLHREIEQLRKSIETLASFPDIDLAELYVAKKCAARILGVCYRTLERWYNSGYIDCIRIGGRVYFPKKELLRIVKNKDGEVSVDLTGKSSGRGAYICPKVECLDKAYKSKALARALDCSIADETYSEMRRVILRRDIER